MMHIFSITICICCGVAAGTAQYRNTNTFVVQCINRTAQLAHDSVHERICNPLAPLALAYSF